MSPANPWENNSRMPVVKNKVSGPNAAYEEPSLSVAPMMERTDRHIR